MVGVDDSFCAVGTAGRGAKVSLGSGVAVSTGTARLVLVGVGNPVGGGDSPICVAEGTGDAVPGTTGELVGRTPTAVAVGEDVSGTLVCVAGAVAVPVRTPTTCVPVAAAVLERVAVSVGRGEGVTEAVRVGTV